MSPQFHRRLYSTNQQPVVISVRRQRYYYGNILGVLLRRQQTQVEALGFTSQCIKDEIKPEKNSELGLH